MANPLIRDILGAALANAMRGRAHAGPYGREPAGGDLGGGVAGAAARASGRSGSAFGGRSALIAMLLPAAMHWVQRNGGIAEVLRRFEQKGFGTKANSWMSTGPNSPLKAEEVDEVVGGEELSRLSRQLGVSDREVALGFADILPEMVDQLTPDGNIPPEADDALDAGRSELERMLAQADLRSPA